jgi:hypothetical protein
MGFAEDQARNAWSFSRGNLDRAVQFLIDGRERMKTLLQDVRARILELKDQLRDALGRHQEGQSDLRERVREDAQERLQKLHTALAEVRAKLADSSQNLTEQTQEAAANLKQRFSDLHGLATEKANSSGSREKLEALDAQLADAQQFLAETLQALRTRAAAAFAGERHGASSDQSAAPMASEADVSEETVRAAVGASESAADAAIAVVDEALREQEGEPSAASPVLKTAGQTPLASCATGCGRPAAYGFTSCCRTCHGTRGGAHGPGCQLKGIGRFLLNTEAARRLFEGGYAPGQPPATTEASDRRVAADTSSDAFLLEENTATDRAGAAGPLEAVEESHVEHANAADPPSTLDAPEAVGMTIAPSVLSVEGESLPAVDDGDVADLVAMGFPKADVREALAKHQGKKDVAVDHLLNAAV